MTNVNMENLTKIMHDQLYHLGPSTRLLGTFPHQPEVNPKGLTPFLLLNPPLVRM